jgi:integral membrane protein
MAYITGVVLMILCFVGIPLQIAGKPAVANNVGVVHGILYIIYLVCAWILSRKLGLATKPTVIMLLAGTIPIMTLSSSAGSPAGSSTPHWLRSLRRFSP